MNGSSGLRLAHGRLLLEERLETLRLPVGGEQRVLVEPWPPVALLDPVALIAVHDARPALDLDQVQPGRADHEQVDLVDRAVRGDELEERVATVGVVLGQPLADVVERLPLPGVLGAPDLLPVLVVRLHVNGTVSRLSGQGRRALPLAARRSRPWKSRRRDRDGMTSSPWALPPRRAHGDKRRARQGSPAARCDGGRVGPGLVQIAQLARRSGGGDQVPDEGVSSPCS